MLLLLSALACRLATLGTSFDTIKTLSDRKPDLLHLTALNKAEGSTETKWPPVSGRPVFRQALELTQRLRARIPVTLFETMRRR